MKINKIKPNNYTLFVKYLPQKRKDGLKDNARFQIRLIALERKAEGIIKNFSYFWLELLQEIEKKFAFAEIVKKPFSWTDAKDRDRIKEIWNGPPKGCKDFFDILKGWTKK